MLAHCATHSNEVFPSDIPSSSGSLLLLFVSVLHITRGESSQCALSSGTPKFAKPSSTPCAQLAPPHRIDSAQAAFFKEHSPCSMRHQSCFQIGSGGTIFRGVKASVRGRPLVFLLKDHRVDACSMVVALLPFCEHCSKPRGDMGVGVPAILGKGLMLTSMRKRSREGYWAVMSMKRSATFPRAASFNTELARLACSRLPLEVLSDVL